MDNAFRYVFPSFKIFLIFFFSIFLARNKCLIPFSPSQFVNIHFTKPLKCVGCLAMAKSKFLPDSFKGRYGYS